MNCVGMIRTGGITIALAIIAQAIAAPLASGAAASVILVSGQPTETIFIPAPTCGDHHDKTVGCQ